MEPLITRQSTREDFINLRDRFGKTMQDVCNESGLSITTIFRAENDGIARMRSGTIYKLNQYYNKLASQSNN